MSILEHLSSIALDLGLDGEASRYAEELEALRTEGQ